VRAEPVSTLAAAHLIDRSFAIELRSAFAEAEQRSLGQLESERWIRRQRRILRHKSVERESLNQPTVILDVQRRRRTVGEPHGEVARAHLLQRLRATPSPLGLNEASSIGTGVGLPSTMGRTVIRTVGLTDDTTIRPVCRR
jgi:hypothetical protein